MWLVKVGSERVGAKVVRYTLLTLIIFMLVCTILAIILVTFASNYSTALNDRTQGKYFLGLLLLFFMFSQSLCPSFRVFLLLPFPFFVSSLIVNCAICLLYAFPSHTLSISSFECVPSSSLGKASATRIF